jgi:hypothetical protein
MRNANSLVHRQQDPIGNHLVEVAERVHAAVK